MFHSALLALIHEAWPVGEVPQAWRNAELVTIPKRGDLSSCDNWRGIALLDVVGKALGRLLQNGLQVVAELELPETQCGFRRGRSCTDHIFTLLQSIEKFNEHQSSGYIVFVDLRKAYDSVPPWILVLGFAWFWCSCVFDRSIIGLSHRYDFTVANQWAVHRQYCC